MRTDAPLLSALLPQQVKPLLWPSPVNPPPLPQILALSLQRDMPTLQPLVARAPPPPIYVLLQGRGKTPLINSTVRSYVPLLSILLFWTGVPLRQPLAEPAPLPLLSALLPQQFEPPLQPLSVNPPPLPQISALPLQLDTPPLQPSAVHAPFPPHISVSLQGQGGPPLLYSTMRTYVPLLSSLLIRQVTPLRQPSDKPTTLHHISD